MKLRANLHISPRYLTRLSVLLIVIPLLNANGLWLQPTSATPTRDVTVPQIVKRGFFRDWATVVKESDCTNEWCAPWKDSRVERAEPNSSIVKKEK